MTEYILAHLPDGPQQDRTRQRLKRTLAAAEELLLEIGPEKTSIPEIEKRSEVPRGAIYRYFPDKYVLFSIISAGYMDLLGRALLSLEPNDRWDELLTQAIRCSAEFYNSHPVASIVIFNGPFTTQDRVAHRQKAVQLMAAIKVQLPTAFSEDDLALTIEIAFACFRYGYFRDEHVSDQVTTAAIRAALGYLKAAVPDIA
ncbi:TetR/AcrR family transcriptional regulator [Paracoccus sp. MBLB3053]|uniref:TetR/AcrR family transcriptional regulator n=1 Tax=Paracoccus aurantius TaxID=3073814 RepID=A0ABU2HYP8_9RHOB|nr:TetR/AcrR family transcriptional regulator [Paracoccus sp. MBLB3053]MDS9470187.1 TetR/AcrR family transcriptional regulator [Paracoccus sp. MBLB3053]